MTKKYETDIKEMDKVSGGMVYDPNNPPPEYPFDDPWGRGFLANATNGIDIIKDKH